MFACLLDREAQVELFHAVSTSGESQLRRLSTIGVLTSKTPATMPCAARARTNLIGKESNP